ncbi:MAG: hypothetical protein JKX85_12780, partial [Phycisphaeraceae bacterium]|nr:hypothetical protein [Phycisphaeraceae bacterium]
ASYLASLYQSLGDQNRFGQWLKVAAQLDSSNRDAARQMYELAVTRGGSNYAVGEMLLRMIKASPMDDMPRHLMAVLLCGMGAYEDAQKQYLIASTLGIKQGGDEFITNWMISLAASGHTDNMLRVISSLGYKAGQADASAIPVDAQVLRLAILTQDGRTSEASQAFTAIRNTLQKRVDMGDVQAALELAWWTAVFGPNLSPSFEQAVSAYAQANAENALIQRTLGWVHYRNGKLDEAANVLHPLVESDVWAVYGLAKCTEAQDAQLYEGYLQKTIRMAGTSPAAMLAARDLRAIGKSVMVGGGVVKIVEGINNLPVNILMPLQARENVWTSLSVEVLPTQYSYLEPIIAKVKLRNSSEYPLTLGPTGTLPSGMAIYLAPWRGGEPIKGMAPILLDVAQTIRLDARETITVPVRLDRGQLGLLMALNPAASIGFSITAVLDPRTSPQGALTTGPLGGVVLVKFVDRTALRPTPANVDAWISQFKSPKDALSHMKLIATLCRLSDSLNKLPQTQEVATRIASAVNAQFDNLGSMGQAWMVLFAPSDIQGQAMFSKLHSGASMSNDVLVRLAYLAVHGKHNPNALAAAASHADARISSFAKALQMP